MQIEFHGAVRTVTGSQHLLTVNGHKILLDCGLFQGRREDSFQRNKRFGFAPEEVDLVVLSHAHIDHAGNIPNLVKNGFQGDIISTYATQDLCTIMLRDSGHIQESDVVYVNKKRAKQGLPPLEPIYTEEDAVNSLKQFVGMGYDRSRQIMPGVWLTFYDAGHILGSATVVLDIEDREGKRDVRLVFSGDIGRPNRPILRDPVPVDRADILLIESTYGDRNHKDDPSTDDELYNVVHETVMRGGKVIVPAFAVGRTQELVYRLHRLIRDGKLSPRLPIYVDSPLAIDATAIYRLHPEAYDHDLRVFMEGVLGDDDPFGFARLYYTRSSEESKKINDLKGPAVIISASGMAESGRILHHLQNNIEDPRNTIVIVGFQAEHTLGRRIVERNKEVRIFGVSRPLLTQVATINGYSGHADRTELLEWVGHLQKPPRMTFIVHGEEPQGMAFAEALRKERGHKEVYLPHLGQRFQL